MAVDKTEVPIGKQIGSPDVVSRQPPPTHEGQQEVIFGATRGWSSINLRELWQYRELLYFLVWRDIKVRYKQTVLGAGWAIIKPFVTMVVFSAVFGSLLSVPSGGLPYPVFAYTALLPWTLFASGVTQAGASLVSNAHLISKVYFPRLIVPIANVLGTIVDFAVAFVVLLALMLFYGIVPGAALATLPFFLLLALLASLGIGLWLGALQVRYRDIGHITPFLVQLGLFATPVAYPATLVPAGWQALYNLNPMVVVVEGFRWALLGSEPVAGQPIAIAWAVVLVVFISGVFFFRRTERDFADVV
jgi:lipopolysaccharide transport system permease protein